MNKMVRNIGYFSLISILLVLSSCKKDPSVLKVFVRSENNQLVENAKVIIIADVNSDLPTPEYVDTVQTNGSGFAYFDLEDFYAKMGKKETVGYFDVLAKQDPKQGNGYIRCRKHITNVITVIIPD